MKKALFISVIALSPLLLAIVPTAESEQKTTEQTGQTGQAESKGSEHAESTEGTAGTECKEGAESDSEGKAKTEEASEHPHCGCGY
jgi:hypothetical protein